MKPQNTAYPRDSFFGCVIVRSQAQEMIYAARKVFEEETLSVLIIPIQKVRECTAAALRISKTTVSNVTKRKYDVTK